jgi:HD-like signal output (HDOD) protein/ActR/RegA family two-component response regulator
MTTEKKRILFVDDEPAILAGLQNLLYRDRKRWDMVFAPGGQPALDEVRKAPFDIVVSDMRMPGIDGAMLLNMIKDECPATVRIMLSGHADREAIVRALPALHQLLSKPCDATTLRGALERSLDGANVTRDALIRQIVGGVDKLPTPLEISAELARLMQSSTTSVADVAKVVTRDPGLSVKLLQLINSAYFGTGQITTSIQQAVALLGIDRLRYIALTASVFASPDEAPVDPTDGATRAITLQEIQSMAVQTALVARSFAEPAMRDEVYAAALLHDVGMIVLAMRCRGNFGEYSERVRAGEDRLALEQELFGVTHSDVGARLLAIWGLPSVLVDAVQYHHDPGSAPEARRQIASIVHVADALTMPGEPVPPLDMASLERAGYAHLVDGWIATARCAG